jgi:hypothetical protein
VRAIDPEQPVLNVQTLDEVVEESLGQRPLAMLLLSAFAVLALLLATGRHLQRARLHGAAARCARSASAWRLARRSRGLLGMIVVEG